jgi:hypothetical protein
MKKFILGFSFCALCFTVWSNAFSQSDTTKYFSLNDTVFEVGSIYYFDAYFRHTSWYDSFEGVELPIIVDFLKTHTNLYVQIGFHRDFRPISITNDTLSKRWAVGLIEQFIKEGVDAERMVPFGYGSNIPRVLKKDYLIVRKNKEYLFKAGTILNKEYIESINDSDMREAAHQLNRRAEIKILRID